MRLVLLFVLQTLITCQIATSKTTASRILIVGEELLKETLPLHSGSRLYRLEKLKPDTRYEVKISYPASIPASFALELKRGESGVGLRMNRRLLNTEKIIFKTENQAQINRDAVYVSVAVEPEGFVAIRNISEREFITYNIVCDELLLGIPHKAWSVVVFVIICLAFTFIILSSFGPYLMHKIPSKHS